MCGRYVHLYRWLDLYEQLSELITGLSVNLRDQPGPPPSYNIAPTSAVPVLRMGRTGLDAYMMRWWLTPSWADSPDTKFPMFNARSETAASKPAFRNAYRRRRCVLPASGFYEWAKVGDRKKQPYYITRADGQPIYFAGLWDLWRDELESCAILTTEPNAEMGEIHNRMPCVLEPEQIAGWMNQGLDEPGRIAEYLRPAAGGTLTMHPVSARVGSSKANDAGLIEPETGSGLFD